MCGVCVCAHARARHRTHLARLCAVDVHWEVVVAKAPFPITSHPEFLLHKEDPGRASSEEQVPNQPLLHYSKEVLPNGGWDQALSDWQYFASSKGPNFI